MRYRLKIHPDSCCDPAVHVEACFARTSSDLLLRFELKGIGKLLIPSAVSSARAEELWRHTCLEAFLCPSAGGDGYYELNLSPSTQWAAYCFAGYRTGMQRLECAEPRVEVVRRENTLELTARISLQCFEDLTKSAAWRIGLSAVIEETSGRLSYWALNHPPGRPDFHHRDGFALELSGKLDDEAVKL
jgi:hypothetical protein